MNLIYFLLLLAFSAIFSFFWIKMVLKFLRNNPKYKKYEAILCLGVPMILGVLLGLVFNYWSNL